MNETIYTSYSQLRTPRHFLREIIEDLRITREIGWQFFLRNLKIQYRQSWLGYLWLIVPPLITAFIWIALNEAKIVNIRETEIPYPVFVVAGMFLWQTFVETINCPIQQLKTAQTMLAKVKIPHETLVLAGLANIFFNLCLRIMILLAIIIWFKIPISIAFLLTPIGIFSLMVFALGIGFLLTPIGLLYNDVSNFIGVLTGVMFFITPIVYPLPKEGVIFRIFVYNPLTPILTTTRNWLTMNGLQPESGFIIITVISILIFIVSWIVYRIAKPHLIVRLSS